MDQYEKDPNFHLFLWKKKVNDFIGVIGVEKTEEGVVLRNLCVNPSHRNEGIATEMINSVENRLNVSLLGTKHTKEFLEYCKREEGC
nr:GNAT family N-acetyltransferase [Evansella tamaricis]